MKISIVDFGSGNIKSIIYSIKKKCKIIKSKKDFFLSKKIIIPGQGNFSNLYKNLKNIEKIFIIKKIIKKNIPILGICLGFQLFFKKNYESNIKGLSLISNNVKKFKKKYCKVPLIGWLKTYNKINKKKKIFYHFHSYYAYCYNTKYCCFYNNYFTSCYKLKNIKICQFHPEKSSIFGKKFLNKF
ncbi:imidazole glycerol phosphate synthase subunit HisH [Candidatus Vidania fulgoroideorum]